VKKFKFVIAIGLSLLVLPAATLQAERSPIFGSATIEALSIEAARDITARGFWADHFGAAAVTHAYNAYILPTTPDISLFPTVQTKRAGI